MFRLFQYIATTGLTFLLLLSGIGLTAGVWAKTNPTKQSSDREKVNPPMDPDDKTEHTSPGVRRGDCLIGENPNSPRALVPDSNDYPLTTMGFPTLFFYIPENVAERVEFLILNDELRILSRNSLEISQDGGVNPGGVISVSLPADNPIAELQPGNSYQWTLALVCIKNGVENKQTNINGWIQRVENSDLEAQVQQANPREVPEIYAEAGIWHDFLTSLANLRRENPDDSELTEYWVEILQSVGLEEVAEKPLTD